ncbi:MAG: ArnT family glycosyltransferase [Anaerolineae bacterium]
MLDDTVLSPTLAASRTAAAGKHRLWHYLALTGVMLLAIFFHFSRLEQEGFGNLYYAAAVKSMLTSWHNFFFVSFDPGGFVTVDKPPLGLWIQAASAWLFGFHGWSLLLPQALAGVLSVLLLYYLVQRVFGLAAGLLAALILALTPIFVAANRNNTMDSQLLFTSLLAAWAITLAAERGRLRWLLLSFFLVGVGFNIKMLQAFLVLPAFYLLYLVAPPIAWWKRPLHLGVATLVLLVVSLAWPVAVDLTPPEARPYVGSSQNNSVLELIIGHNGLSRLLPGGVRGLLGQGGPPPGGPQPGRLPPDQPPPGLQTGPRPSGPPPNSLGAQPGHPPPGGAPLPNRPRGIPQPPGGAPGANGPQNPLRDETGTPGLLRLFNQQLAGQISWLLPLAAIGLLAAARQVKRRRPLGPRRQALLLWGAWLLPQLVFFSVANLFHRYYLEMLAPAIAGLAAAGLVALWQVARRPGWAGWLLPATLTGGTFFQAAILADFPEWSRWLTPLVVGLSLIAAVSLSLLRLARLQGNAAVFSRAALALGIVALLIAPAVWSYTPIQFGGQSGLPFAGPDLETGGPGPRNENQDVSRLVAYLEANHGEEEFLAAAYNAHSAAPIILATGQPVMAMGGFSGGDPILTADELAGMVAEGAVRFFLLSERGRGGQELGRWVQQHCQVVPSRLWQSPGSRGAAAPGGPNQLYDCADG